MALPRVFVRNKTAAAGQTFFKLDNVKIFGFHALWPRKRNSSYGFTVVEVLVVISLIAIISALGLAMSMDSYRGFSFRNDRDAAVAALQRARSQAINNVCLGAGCVDGKKHGVHFAAGAGEIVIFQGDSYNSGDTANETVKFESSATAVTATTDVIFDRISGASSYAQVTMTDNAGRTAVIEINDAGRINY